MLTGTKVRRSVSPVGRDRKRKPGMDHRRDEFPVGLVPRHLPAQGQDVLGGRRGQGHSVHGVAGVAIQGHEGFLATLDVAVGQAETAREPVGGLASSSQQSQGEGARTSGNKARFMVVISL